MVGRSDIMQEVFRLVEQVAPARSTILITGEAYGQGADRESNSRIELAGQPPVRDCQ